MSLLDALFGYDAIEQIFSDPSRLQRMLDFEAALARAQARAELIPKSAAGSIANQCKAELFDLGALSRASVKAGNLAIPMVKQLTELVAQHDKDAARYVHWGATSQDAIDTGLVLQLRDAFKIVLEDVDRLCAALANLAAEHRETILAGRTWLQHAVPTVFGLKVAGWLDAMGRNRVRLQEAQARALVLQFGGAAGTLASLGNHGLDLSNLLAEELHIELPALPWHAQRDRLAEVATTFAILAGTLGKMARDISLQMQTEISEVSEPMPAGQGGSSTMPQKRNPVACAIVLAAAQRVPALLTVMLGAMTQEHERGLGGWHAEWQTLPDIVRLTAGALHNMVATIQGLEVDPHRMRQNLDMTHGLILAEAVSMALAKHVGKAAAHQTIEAASRKATLQKKHLLDVLSEDTQVTAHISTADLKKLFDPLTYTGVAGQFIDRAIAAHKAGSR